MYKMFIDDERYPQFLEKHCGFSHSACADMIIVRSSAAAIKYIEENGVPSFISFDHDLGGDDTSRKVVHWLVDALIDEKVSLPSEFDFFVHSQNPIGAKWLRDTMRDIVTEFQSSCLRK